MDHTIKANNISFKF